MTSIPRSTSRGVRVLLVAGAILTAALITQCRMVTDSVTRPQEMAEPAGSCASKCAHKFVKDLHKEQDRFEDALEDCRKNKPCKQAEIERHRAAIKSLLEQFKACKDGCHHQGGGKGGRK